MHTSRLSSWALILCAASAPAIRAQVAGSTTLGISISQISEVALGWSARRQILGRAVFNEKNEKIGTVDDLIIAPDKALSYAIIGAGGFVGLGRHDVAIPVNQFAERNGKLVLNGATRDAIKAMPPFEYGQGGR